MRLDRTKIVIRERSLLDILDMSLRVVTTFGLPLLFCFVVLIVPLMFVNGWLIGAMPEFGEAREAVFKYCWAMALLVFLQAPLVSLLATPFLGNAMFLDDVGPRKFLQTIRNSSFALVWTLLLLRGIAFSWMLAWSFRDDGGYAMHAWLTVLSIYVALVRASRPFINEVILLERNPIFSKDSGIITMGRRSSALHGPNFADLVSRWIGSAMVAVVLSTSIFCAIWFLWGMLLFDWNWGPVMLHICYPLSLWLVASYFTIVRFLSYLDLRIRREGWEVELIVRAAANGLIGVSP